MVVGGGHNGLVAACYLAKAGRSVVVLEKAEQVGGACVTREYTPGFRFSACAFLFGLFRPQILRDLELHRFGYEAYSVNPTGTGIFDDGSTLLLWQEVDRTLAEIRKFDAADAESFLEFGLKLQRFANIMEPWLLKPPPTGEQLARTFREAAAESLYDEFVPLSVEDLLARHFHSPKLRGFFTFLSMVSIHAGPSHPGTAYQLAHHAWGEFEGSFGAYGFVRGGIGGVTDALAACARHYGAEIRTAAPVDRLRVSNGAVDGVVLAGGDEVDARVVLSNVDPRTTLLELLSPADVPAEARTMAECFDVRGSMARIHLATDSLPMYTAFGSRGVGPEHQGHQLLGADTRRFELAWRAQSEGRLPDEFVIELVTQSAHDPSVAPPGKHTLALGIQNLPFELEGGWDARREEFADRVIAQLAEYAPNIPDAIIDRHVITPLDLEREWSLPGGNIFQGAQSLTQIFSHRPFPGWSRYRMPVRNLYLCGAGAHPGGGVTGAPGHNAAQAVLSDFVAPAQDHETWVRRATAAAAGDEIAAGAAALSLQERMWRQPALRKLATRAAGQRWTRPLVQRMRRTGR